MHQMINQQHGETSLFYHFHSKINICKKKKKNIFDGVIKMYLQISRKHNFQNKEVILS